MKCWIAVNYGENRERCNSEKQINSFIFKYACLQNDNVLCVASLHKGFVLDICSPIWNNYDLYTLNDTYLWHLPFIVAQ